MEPSKFIWYMSIWRKTKPCGKRKRKKKKKGSMHHIGLVCLYGSVAYMRVFEGNSVVFFFSCFFSETKQA